MPSVELRREVKFALAETVAARETLESVLDVNCRRVRYRGATSRVVSLYFDDARLSACRDNLEGVPRRAKVRLRWYDAELPSGRAFLERKWREGSATGKERVAVALTLTGSVALSRTPMHRLASALSRGVPDSLREALLARPNPVVVVDYERAYYEAVGAPVRVTVDSGLRFFGQLGAGFVRRRFPERARGLVIVEGKTPPGEEHLLEPLLRPLSLRLTRASKYVMACRAVGLLPGWGYRP